MCENKNEIWLPVVGRESYYEVSNTGKVRSIVGRYKTKPIFELKQFMNKHGYCSVDLSFPEHRKELVHRLVAHAFIPKDENSIVVNHLDNNPSNNFVENLEWTTYSGNLIHAQKQGRLFEAQSKGGKAQSEKSTKVLLDDVDSMINKQYGNWTVLKLDRIRKYGNVNRPMLLCRCVCGSEVAVCRINLQNGQSTRCRKCAMTEISRVQQEIVVQKYSNTTHYHWTFTANSNLSVSKSTKHLKLEAVCNKCNHIQNIFYTSLRDAGNKISCKKCKTQVT